MARSFDDGIELMLLVPAIKLGWTHPPRHRDAAPFSRLI